MTATAFSRRQPPRTRCSRRSSTRTPRCPASPRALRCRCEAGARGGSIELFGDGRPSRDFTYVGDVVTAIRAAAAEGAAGRAYNVGGGDPISLNAALEQLASIAGRPLDVRRTGRESGDVLHTAADGSRAREELGFAPATTLATGLRAEYEWVLERAEAGRPLAALSNARSGS